MGYNILCPKLIRASKRKSKNTRNSTITKYLKEVLKVKYLGMIYLVLQFVKGK